MTPQEAIERLREIPVRPKPDNALDLQAIYIAVKALEKQIVKETVTTSDDVFEFGNCPHCNETFNTELVGEYEITHCPWCGQALDWGG